MEHKTEESRLNYNQKAEKYESTYEGKFTMPYNKFICDIVLLKDGDTVLDVACGNGRLLKMLSKNAKINGFGIDISEEMINVASKENKGMNFEVSQANKTPFEDNKFDLITVCCAFHHFVNPKGFMMEANRILKKGAKLIIADPTMPIVFRQITNSIFPLLKTGDVKIYSKSEMVSFFEKANFNKISITKRAREMYVEGIKTM